MKMINYNNKTDLYNLRACINIPFFALIKTRDKRIFFSCSQSIYYYWRRTYAIFLFSYFYLHKILFCTNELQMRSSDFVGYYYNTIVTTTCTRASSLFVRSSDDVELCRFAIVCNAIYV